MNQPLTRCDHSACERKDSCRRFVSMEQAAAINRPIMFYVAPPWLLEGSKSSADCTAFIQREERKAS